VAYAPPAPKKEGKKEDSLETFIAEKAEGLAKIVAQMHVEKHERVVLSELVIRGIYVQYLYIRKKLLEVLTVGVFARADVRRLGELESQLDELRAEIRRERVQCWQDIATLNRDFRKWAKQYADTMQRVRLVLVGGKGKKQQEQSGWRE
jgi:hypothetical protein